MLEKIKQMIKDKKDLNKPDANGELILHSAVRERNLDAVKLLIESGAKINQPDPNDISALMIASWNGDKDIAQFLIENGANVNFQNKFGYSPLICATFANNSEMIDFLLQNEIGLNDENFDGDTALLIAIKNNNEEIASKLILNKADIHHKNKEGKDALMLAALGGYTNLVQVLLSHGSNVLSMDKEENTALLLATQTGHLDVVRLLDKAGSNLNAENKNGFRAFELAAVFQHDSLIDYFRERHGLDVCSWKNKPLPNKFWNAVRMGDIEVVKNMISSGRHIPEIYINGVDKDGKTALMLAAAMGHEKILTYLIENGSDLSQKDYKGHTAIDYAVNTEEYEMAGLLKKAMDQEKKTPRIFNVIQNGTVFQLERFILLGFDVNAQSEEGDSPLSIAVLKNDFEKVKILLDCGADLYCKNKNGEGVLHQIEKSDVSAFRMLQMVNILKDFNFPCNLILDHPKRTICDVICSKAKSKEELKFVNGLVKKMELKRFSEIMKIKRQRKNDRSNE